MPLWKEQEYMPYLECTTQNFTVLRLTPTIEFWGLADSEGGFCIAIVVTEIGGNIKFWFFLF